MSQSPGNQSHCTPRLFSFGNYREASQKGFNVFSIQDVGWKPECLNYQVLNLSTSPHKVFHGHCSLTVCFSALKMSAPVRGLGISASGWTTSLTYLYLTIYLLRFEIVPVPSLSQSKRKPSDVWLVVPSWSLSGEQIIFHISDIFHISGKSSPMFICSGTSSEHLQISHTRAVAEKQMMDSSLHVIAGSKKMNAVI